jgi:predicted dehydrogenase
MSKLKVAVVGAGILGSRHARVFAEQPECELVAVIDINEERAKKVAAPLNAKAFTDFQKVLDNEKVEVLAIATPDHLHRAPALAALKAGKHIFMEKPIATTLEDITAITAASEAASATVSMVNYSQRYLTDYAWIKQHIMAGAIGQPVLATSIKHDTIYVPTGMIASWASNTSPIYFMSSHDLDLVHWFVGSDPVQVAAHETRGVLEAKGINAHDGLNALIKFANGASGNFHSSWIHPNTYPAIADGYMQIIGSEGAISYNNRLRKADIYNQKSAQEITFSGIHTATEVDSKLVGAFTDSVRHFLTCILEKREPDTAPRKVLATAKAQAAIIESIQKQQMVQIT